MSTKFGWGRVAAVAAIAAFLLLVAWVSLSPQETLAAPQGPEDQAPQAQRVVVLQNGVVFIDGQPVNSPETATDGAGTLLLEESCGILGCGGFKITNLTTGPAVVFSSLVLEIPSEDWNYQILGVGSSTIITNGIANYIDTAFNLSATVQITVVQKWYGWGMVNHPATGYMVAQEVPPLAPTASVTATVLNNDTLEGQVEVSWSNASNGACITDWGYGGSEPHCWSDVSGSDTITNVWPSFGSFEVTLVVTGMLETAIATDTIEFVEPLAPTASVTATVLNNDTLEGQVEVSWSNASNGACITDWGYGGSEPHCWSDVSGSDTITNVWPNFGSFEVTFVVTGMLETAIATDTIEFVSPSFFIFLPLTIRNF